MMSKLFGAIAVVFLLASAAHAQRDNTALLPPVAGRIEGNLYITSDGLSLPLSIWQADGLAKAVVVAVHGMNDYRLAWASPAAAWTKRGIITYAYDQPGFGGGGERGRWYGAEPMAAYLADFVRLVAARHPGVPIFLMGESLGGAVVLLTATRPDAPPVAGVVLAAPALWPQSVKGALMHELSRAGRLLAPDWTFPSSRQRSPASDDPAVLAQLHADPMVIHETRLDTLAGIVELMDMASRRGPQLRRPVLLLFGDNDRLVDRKAIARLAETLPSASLGLYPRGRHLLFRSLDAADPTSDVAAWVLAPNRPLTSEAGRRGRLCRDYIANPKKCRAAMQKPVNRP